MDAGDAWSRQEAALFGLAPRAGSSDEAVARQLQREEEAAAQRRDDAALARRLQEEEEEARRPPQARDDAQALARRLREEDEDTQPDLGEVRRACGRSLFVDTFGDGSWLRPEEIQRVDDESPRFVFQRRRSDFCVIRDDPRPEDVVQGSVGNCYFVSTIASVVATAPEVITSLFEDGVATTRDADRGAHGVKLCVGGVWRTVVVDERFPVRGGGVTMTQFAFASSKRRQLFPQLLEKAFAKLCGGYERLEGGQTKEALALLTGCPCEDLHLSSEAFETTTTTSPHQSQSSTSLPDEEVEALVWAKVLSAREAGFIVCASTKAATGVGLAPHHGYSVVDVLELYDPPPPLGDGRRHRLLRLANPHGAGSPFVWRGAWSDGDTTRWRPETRQIAGGGRSGGPASFFMSLEDLRRHFHILTICEYRPDWADARVPFDLASHDDCAFEVTTTAGDSDDKKNAAVEATFEIAQPLARATPYLGAGVVIDAGSLVLDGQHHELIGAAESTVDNPTARCHLRRSCYVIPLSFNDQRTKRATFASRTSMPVLVRQIQIDPRVKRRALLDYAVTRGKVAMNTNGFRLFHKTDQAAIYVVVENRDPIRRSLRIDSTVHDARGLSLSRGGGGGPPLPGHVIVISSEVPPGHTALVLVLAARAMSFSHRLQHHCTLVPSMHGFFGRQAHGSFDPALPGGHLDIHYPVPIHPTPPRR